MFEITFRHAANRDINRALDYLIDTLNAPKAADDMLDELDRMFDRLSAFPYVGGYLQTSQPLQEEVRYVLIKGFVLYYCVYPDRIEIRRFLHARQDRQKQSYDLN